MALLLPVHFRESSKLGSYDLPVLMGDEEQVDPWNERKKG